MEFETERHRVDPALRNSVLQCVEWKKTNDCDYQPTHSCSNSHSYHARADGKKDDEIARQVIQASIIREVAATYTSVNAITSGTNEQSKKLQ